MALPTSQEISAYLGKKTAGGSKTPPKTFSASTPVIPTSQTASSSSIPSSGDIASFLKTGKKPAAPALTKIPAVKPFAAVDTTGNSFGFSDTEKDTSGRPFFAFRKPGDTSTTTDYTRVATPFDPRVAAPQTRDSFYNPRAVNLRAQLKDEMGIAYSDELDHRIALALSGSNAIPNLKAIPAVENESYGKDEAKYAKLVQDGKMSLFDAQVAMAKEKGFTTPFTGKTGILDTIKGGIKKVGTFFKNLVAPEAQAETATIPSHDQIEAQMVVKKPDRMAAGILGLLPTPSTATANSTQQVATPGDRPFDYLFNPRGEVAAPKVPFSTQAEQAAVPKFVGPRIITGPVKILSDLLTGIIEAAPNVTVRTYEAMKQFQGKNQTTQLPFNPERIGIPNAGGNKTVPLYEEAQNRISELDKERPNTPNVNVLQSFAETILPTVLNAFITGDLAKGATLKLLEWSKSSPELGLSSQAIKNLSAEDAVKEVGNRFIERVNQIVKANTAADGSVTANGKLLLQKLGYEAKRLGTSFSDGTIPELNPIGRWIDNLSIKLNQDVANFGKTTGLSTAKINPAEETLPGYRARPGQAPAVGLSMQEQEPVGFGANDAKKNIQNKMKDIEDYDAAIASGEMKADMLYKDPEKKILQPSESKRLAYDMQTDLEKVKPGLGKEFQNSIDLENTTVKEMGEKANALIDKSMAKPKVVEKPMVPAVVEPAATKELANIVTPETPTKPGESIKAPEKLPQSSRTPLPKPELDTTSIPLFRGDNTTEIRPNNAGTIDVTSDKTVAAEFAKKYGKKAVVNELRLVPSAKVLKIQDYFKKIGKDSFTESDVINFAENNGFDAIDFRGVGTRGFLSHAEIKILNPDVISTNLKGKFNEKVPSSGPLPESTTAREGAFQQHINNLNIELRNLEQALAGNRARSLSKIALPSGELPLSLSLEQISSHGFKDVGQARLAYANYRLQQKRIETIKHDISKIQEIQAKAKTEDKNAKSVLSILKGKLSPKTFADLAKKEKPPKVQALLNQRNKIAQDRISLAQKALQKSTPPLEQESLEKTAQMAQEIYSMQYGRPDLSSLDRIIIDTSTPVKRKVNMIDYMRTPDRVLKKLGLAHIADRLQQAYESYLLELPLHLEVINDWQNRVTDKGGNKRIFRFLDGQYNRDFYAGRKLDPLSKSELKVAYEIRAYLQEWAQRLGLPEDNQITHYITHIFGIGEAEKEFDEDVAKIIRDQVPGSVYDPFLLKRLGRRGYIEDTWQALEAYAKRAVRKANMDPALEQLKTAAGRLEDSQERYIKRLGDRINMRPTEIDNLLDNTIKSIVGYRFGQRPTAYLSGGARRLVYRAMLGLNVGSAVKNLTQGINTFAKLGTKYTLIGYLKLGTLMNSNELEEQGILKQDFVQDKTVSVVRKNLARMDKGLFYLFELAEKINRGSAYFGAKAKAINAGHTVADAIKYAKKIVRDTQFVFGAVDTPVAMNSDIMKILTQFGSFGVKQTEFATEMFKQKEWMGILRYIAAALTITYGVGKAFNISITDFIPGYSFLSRFGTPPALAVPWEIIKAIADAPGSFGQKRDTTQKLQDIAAVVPYPAKIQAEKTYKGIKAYTNPSGEVAQTTPNLIKATLFGTKNLVPANQEVKQATQQEIQTRKTVTVDAQNEYDRLTKMSKADAAAEFNKLATDNPALAKKVATLVSDAARNLTARDKGLLFLGIKNGSRAKAILTLLNNLKTNAEKAALWNELVTKKVITKDVNDQLLELLKK